MLCYSFIRYPLLRLMTRALPLSDRSFRPSLTGDRSARVTNRLLRMAHDDCKHETVSGCYGSAPFQSSPPYGNQVTTTRPPLHKFLSVMTTNRARRVLDEEV